VRAFIARVIITLGRLLRDILVKIIRGHLSIVTGVKGAEESNLALTSYLIFFFIPFPFLIRAFRTGVSVRTRLSKRIKGRSGY
jgi:hypothetical protein